MKPNLRLLPTEVWVDILCFPWIGSPASTYKRADKRSELGRLVDRIGNRKFAEFLQFYLHEWGKHELGWLEFTKEGHMVVKAHPYSGNGTTRVEVAQTEMPENIKFFKQINIWHFDTQTLGFLRRIQPLLANPVNLSILMGTSNEHLQTLRTILAHLSPLLDGGLHSVWTHSNILPWAQQQQLFAGNLRLDKCKVLSFNHKGYGSVMVQPREEQLAALDTTITFCREWLTAEGRDCTEPRLFSTHINPEFFGQISAAIRQDFLSAKRPCTFVLKMQRGKYFPGEYLDDADIQLQLERNTIGEQLHGKLVDGADGEQCFQISRHQANANAGQQLEEWVEEIERKCRNETRIRLYDTTIGQIDATGDGEVDDGGEGKAADQPSTSKQ